MHITQPSVKKKFSFPPKLQIIIVLLPSSAYSDLQKSCHDCGLLSRKMGVTNQKLDNYFMRIIQ